MVPPVRVLIIDDSVVARRTIRRVLEGGGMAVVGEAADGRAGRDLILALAPDVVTLDLEMPDVDGLTLLRAITQHAPRPVVVLSGRLDPAMELSALQAGAAHVLAKPTDAAEAAAFAPELLRRVQQAARAVARFDTAGPTLRAAVGERVQFMPGQLVAIGASTGGPQALRVVLGQLPERLPPVVIAQHTPPDRRTPLAERLGAACRLDVQVAVDGEDLRDGMVRLAPPDRHLLVEWAGAGYRTRLSAGPAVHFQRPAVDVLFRSVAASAGRRVVAALLTGMGEDGAEALGVVRDAGGRTIAQDEATSVVFGMPRVAIERGAASSIAPLDRIAATIVRDLDQRAVSRAS